MTDGARLLAAGEPITLANGHTVNVRYGMRSLLELERRFGGLAHVQSAISDDGTGAMVEPSLQLVTCGLLHEHDGNGAPLTVDRLAELLPPELFQTAVQTAARAMEGAFPTPAAAAPAAAAPASDGFPGQSGTTPRPSSSDALTMSGGA